MRRKNDNKQVIEAVNYLHGRLELEIEYYCHHKGVDPLEITQIVGAKLIGAPMDNLPALLQATRATHRSTPEVEVVNRTYGRRTQPAKGNRSGKTPSHQMTLQKAYWAKKTPAQRRKEMAKRMAKWKPASKAKFLHRKAKNKPMSDTQKAKRKVYKAREIARKKGLPEPPLPERKAS